MTEPGNACGDLRERLQVLTLAEGSGSLSWEPCRTVWGNVQPQTGRVVYSRTSVSAPGVQIVLRRQPLQLTDALRWRGRHVFLTDIRPHSAGRGHLLVTGALVDVARCVRDVNLPGGGLVFPAVLAERYARQDLEHDQLEPYAVNRIRYVLVAPKSAALTRGALVEVDGALYEVQLAHVLDGMKTEYEIVRKEDL